MHPYFVIIGKWIIVNSKCKVQTHFTKGVSPSKRDFGSLERVVLDSIQDFICIKKVLLENILI